MVDPLLAALIRERYSHPNWWHLTQPEPADTLHDRTLRHALEQGLERIEDEPQEVA